MSASSSEHVDNLSNGLHNNNNDNNNKCTNLKTGLGYMIAKDDILIFRCFKCKINYKMDFDKELILIGFQAYAIFVKEILINLFCC